MNSECSEYEISRASARWRQIAPLHCSYGYDVIAQIGWQRQTYAQRFGVIHTNLRERGIQISETHVRHLYSESYLP